MAINILDIEQIIENKDFNLHIEGVMIGNATMQDVL